MVCYHSADHDNRLQIDLSQRHCHSCAHQWLPFSTGRQNGQVVICFLSFLFPDHPHQNIDFVRIPILLQEAGPWFCEVLHVQFLLGLLPMVLFWWRYVRFLTVPYFWFASLEAEVYLITSIQLKLSLNV